jgi:hypothetical protein
MGDDGISGVASANAIAGGAHLMPNKKAAHFPAALEQT